MSLELGFIPGQRLERARSASPSAPVSVPEKHRRRGYDDRHLESLPRERLPVIVYLRKKGDSRSRCQVSILAFSAADGIARPDEVKPTYGVRRGDPLRV